MEKQGTIYKIENLVNGKVYIGQTIKDASRRIQCHIIKLNKKYHNNRHLQHAWNKYGEDNFRYTIIETCTEKEMDDREMFWIKHCINTVGVYNIEGGGNNRKIITDETRKRLSEAGKRAYQNPITLKRRIKQWEKISGKNHFNNKPVICVTDGLVFYSITAAAQHYGVDMKAISQALSGRNPYCKSADGRAKLEFDFYKEGQVYLLKNHIHGQSKAVFCPTTGEEFPSVTHAAEKYGLPTTNISKACKGQRKYAGKLDDGTPLKWEYVT